MLKSPKEQEYIAFLWDAFETNYTHGKYQFAFLAYHMLTMSSVYFNIWQIKQTEPEDFVMGLIGARTQDKATGMTGHKDRCLDARRQGRHGHSDVLPDPVIGMGRHVTRADGCGIIGPL